MVTVTGRPAIPFKPSSMSVLPPLQPVAPSGSLIYDSQFVDRIWPGVGIDTHQIDLEAGQRLTVIATGDAPLIPSVNVIGPSGSIGSATAAGAGQDLVLNSLEIATAGSYTIEISGASGTSGDYTLELVTNAAAELESYGGPGNDTLATAQNIDASNIVLDVGAADRMAVIGELPTAGGDDWYRFTTSAGGSNTVALTQLGPGNATLELYDDLGDLLAVGVTSENADQVISHYLTGAASTRYVRVAGAEADYSLLITGDSGFDREVNDDGQTQDLSPIPSTTVLGAVLATTTGGLEPDDYPAGTVMDLVNSAVTLSDNVTGGSIYASDASTGATTGVRAFWPEPGAGPGFRRFYNEFRGRFRGAHRLCCHRCRVQRQFRCFGSAGIRGQWDATGRGG